LPYLWKRKRPCHDIVREKGGIVITLEVKMGHCHNLEVKRGLVTTLEEEKEPCHDFGNTGAMLLYISAEKGDRDITLEEKGGLVKTLEVKTGPCHDIERERDLGMALEEKKRAF
jgi:hypothetical protein